MAISPVITGSAKKTFLAWMKVYLFQYIKRILALKGGKGIRADCSEKLNLIVRKFEKLHVIIDHLRLHI
jgi:hypothetical protein